jgi:hypothetical protein
MRLYNLETFAICWECAFALRWPIPQKLFVKLTHNVISLCSWEIHDLLVWPLTVIKWVLSAIFKVAYIFFTPIICNMRQKKKFFTQEMSQCKKTL